MHGSSAVRRRIVALAGACALAAAVLSVPAAAADSSSPGPVPPQCSDDPTVIQSEGGVPPAGLLGPAPDGCLIQSGEAGFTLQPHVLHVGQAITATVIPRSHPDSWSWGNIEAVLGAGSRKHHAHCADDTTSCTFFVGPEIVSTKYQVYSEAITVPLFGQPAGAVSSDYFIVNNDLEELRGTVTDATGQPVADAHVRAAGRHGSTTTTGPDGRYVLVLRKGTYDVSASAPNLVFSPRRETVRLERNVNGVDFQVLHDEIAFHFTALNPNLPGGSSAGNASITGVGPAVNGDTTDMTPDGDPVSAVLQFSPFTETPKALVCAPTGLLYPQLDANGNPTAFNPFERATHPPGHTFFTVYAGSEQGAWNLDAIEAGRPHPASASTALDFTITTRHVGLQDVAQRLYDVVASIRGSGQNRGSVPIFRITVPAGAVSPGQVTAARAANQEILLAFLADKFDQIGPTDFGPVHTNGTTLSAGKAGVEFYDADGQAVVLDTETAEQIINAAGLGQPLPPQDQFLPSTAQYEQQNGLVVPGHLVPDPSDSLTYFGFPYPPLTSDGVVDSQFSSNCVRPDTQQLRVEVDSPVNVLFTGAGGEQFGVGANGRTVTTGPGLELRGPGGEHTFILPAGAYSMALTGTGAGVAHVSVFTAATRSERAQVYTFPVKRGQRGSLPVAGAGAAGSVRFAGRSYRASAGMPLRLRSTPGRVRHGRRSNVLLHVTDAIGRPVSGVIVTVSSGRRVVASGATGRAGTVRLRIPSLRRGRLTAGAAAPSTRPARLTIRVV